MPLVSVIMPVFNRREVAPRAIRSVLGQSGVDFELIVVDDASDRPAEEVYEEVREAGHSVLYQSHNCGPGAARNLGASRARGDWLAFLDSDDYWLESKLATHLESLRRSGLSIGQTEEIWYREGERVNPPKAHKISGGDLFRRSLRAVCVSSSSVVLKRSLFESHGGFDESFFVCEDYDLWLRVAAVHPFDFCPEPLVVKHGGHEDQLSRALPAMDRFRIVSLLKGLNQEGAWQTPERVEAIRSELHRKLRILSKGSAKRGLDRVVSLCAEVVAAVGRDDVAGALELARELLLMWPARTGS